MVRAGGNTMLYLPDGDGWGKEQMSSWLIERGTVWLLESVGRSEPSNTKHWSPPEAGCFSS